MDQDEQPLARVIGETWRNDQRIDALLSEKIASGAIVAYLREALRQCRGNLIVARLMVQALAPFLPPAGQVSMIDVARLAVQEETDAIMSRLYEALRERVPNVLERVRDLALDLSHDLSGIPSDIEPTTTVELMVPRRKAVSTEESDTQMYLRIFQCALAMCLALTIDPRQAAAA